MQSRLTPTTVMPMTAPEEKATRSAGLRPARAFAVVRTFARTAIVMPTKPAPAEAAAPAR